MKVALITGEYWPYIRGGCGISATLLVQQLRKEKIVVDVYVFNKKQPQLVTDKGFAIYFDAKNEKFWPFINLQTIMKLWKKLAKYDVIHVYSTVRMAALGYLRSTFLKIPVVATLNGEEGACIDNQRFIRNDCKTCDVSRGFICAFRRAKKVQGFYVPSPVLASYFVIHRMMSQKLDRYFALSNVIKSLYTRCGFSEEKIKVIPNMYDPLFLSKLEQANIIKPKKVIILYVGRLAREKGVDDLIKAFSILKSSNAELWIAGRGPEERVFKKLAKNSQRNIIKFLGFVDHNKVYKVYKMADIFVHPSKWPEPFARSILEAMLARLAIVASDCGANSEVLGDAGLIYKRGDIFDLSEKLEFLINNEKIRNDLGMRAYNKVLNDYSPEKITHQVICEYKSLCS